MAFTINLLTLECHNALASSYIKYQLLTAPPPAYRSNIAIIFFK